MDLSLAIVIPNYNQTRFLATALESIRHQQVPLQVAVMDGGSTDNVHQMVNRYADLITYFVSKRDGGQSAAIITGEQRIPGDIVTWLNADDYYFPGVLDKVLGLFAKHPDIDVIYGDAIHVTPEGFFLSYFPAIHEFDPDLLTRTCFICQPACFIRRSAYQKVGGLNSRLYYTMDWDLWCKLARSGAKFLYLKDVLAAVRYYPGTKTLSRDWNRYMEIWRIERRYGRRLLPRSWVGSYLFDLEFEKNKNAADRLTHGLLMSTRKIKRKLVKPKATQQDMIQTNYGFNSWRSIAAAGRGVVHIPWYGTNCWRRLLLNVEPTNASYRFKINGRECNRIVAQNGHICIDLPEIKNPKREIMIECTQKRKWQLNRVAWEI